MELLPALVGAVVGLIGGLGVPRLIALCPEPEVNPEENPEHFPDHVPFAELARRSGLAWRSSVACAIAGAALGGVIGFGWALPWLLVLVPVCCALTVIDYVTWYLPSRLIWPAVGITAVLEIVAAIALEAPRVALWGAIGLAALGAYHWLMWLISPRIMAFGDVRLSMLLGLALGPFGPGMLVLSVLCAAIVSVLLLVPMKLRGVAIARGGSRRLLKAHVPYGPSMVIGALAAVIAGQVLITI